MDIDLKIMIPLEEFSERKGIAPSKVVEMIRDGFYVGHIKDNEWYVAREELGKIESDASQSSNKESPYPIFSRKQLAWMGIFTGIVILVLLNVKFDYRSAIETVSREMFSYKNREAGFWGMNIVLAGAIWALRVHLGALFAFLLGILLNVITFISKKV